MNKKTLLLLPGLLVSGSVVACPTEVIPVAVETPVVVATPEVVVTPVVMAAPVVVATPVVVAAPRVGPNYSGYYNYLPGAAYNYVGPNYSGYYNYPFPGPAAKVIVVHERMDVIVN